MHQALITRHQKMNIYLASDHRGFQLKQHIKQTFPNFIDVGAFSYDPDDDEIDFGSAAVKQMGVEDRAILLCGSGHGMDITANRFPHIRGILGFNHEVVKMGREHKDANVLILPAEWLNTNQATDMVNIFLSTPFSGKERYIRRLQKIESLSTKHQSPC